MTLRHYHAQPLFSSDLTQYFFNTSLLLMQNMTRMSIEIKAEQYIAEKLTYSKTSEMKRDEHNSKTNNRVFSTFLTRMQMQKED